MTAIVRSYGFSGLRVANRDDSSQIPIDAQAATIAFDRSWSPYVQGTLTCGALSASALAALDPRLGQRIRWRLTQTQPDGSSFYRDFDLGVRSRQQSWATGDVTLTVASDEAIAQDYGYTSAQVYGGGVQNSAYRACDVAQFALGGVAVNGLPTVSYSDGTPYVMVNYEDAGADTGTTAWDWVSQLAEASSAWVFCDERAQWLWTAPTYRADATTYSLSDADSVIDVADTISRDDPTWGTAVVLAYQGNSPVQYLTSAAATEPRKTITLQRPRRRPTNGSAAGARAQAQLHGRSLRLRAAADIRLRPNMTTAVAWMGQAATGTVQSVAFDFPAGTMDLVVNI